MSQKATDDFNRADSGTLGSNWTKLSSFSDLRITSNQCKASVAGDNVDAYTGFGSVDLDQYSQCKVATVASDGGPTVRSNTTSTFYLLDTAATSFRLYKCVSGSFTVLDNVTVTLNANDTAYIEAHGTTLTTKQNSSVVNQITDSAIDGSVTGGRYPGLHAFDQSIVYDDFAMGDLSPGPSSIFPFIKN